MAGGGPFLVSSVSLCFLSLAVFITLSPRIRLSVPEASSVCRRLPARLRPSVVDQLQCGIATAVRMAGNCLLRFSNGGICMSAAHGKETFHGSGKTRPFYQTTSLGDLKASALWKIATPTDLRV